MILKSFTYALLLCKPQRMAFYKISTDYNCFCFIPLKTLGKQISLFSHIINFQTHSPISQENYEANKNIPGKDSAKEDIITKMNFQSKEHAKPFHRLPLKTLLHIYKVTKNDEKHGYCKNRLYYLSDKLKCPPSLLSKYIAQKYFVYSLSFDWLENSLHVLLEMGVSCDRIIRDLWVLKYKPETIRERLQRVKAMGMEKTYPWMVRCTEDILKRYVSISKETKDILGNDKSTHIYLAQRLNITLEDVEEMCKKTPALKTIRATKVKHFLDYLISEGITTEDIANVPRILSASQKTVKERINKLRELGFQEINLNVLCRSRKHFKKLCDSYEPSSKKSF